jgi:hypothetical protein
MRKTKASEAVQLAQGHLARKAHLAPLLRLSSIPLGWQKKSLESPASIFTDILKALTL